MEVRGARWWRIGAVVLFTVALVVVAKVTGLTGYLERDRLRAIVASAGAWGPALFLAAFCAGELLHVPGTVFVAVAVVAYGRTAGGLLAYAGAIASFTFVFVVVRAIGGRPLAEIRWALVRKVLSHLDERPARTVAIARLILWMSPQLNYVLALSSVRFVPYLVGSALGLAGPVFVIVVFLDHFLN